MNSSDVHPPVNLFGIIRRAIRLQSPIRTAAVKSPIRSPSGFAMQSQFDATNLTYCKLRQFARRASCLLTAFTITGGTRSRVWRGVSVAWGDLEEVSNVVMGVAGNGVDLVEIVSSDVFGGCGDRDARHHAEPIAICVDDIFRSLLDRVSAHRRTFRRRLHLVPRQWALQGYAEAMFRLSQWSERAGKAAVASASDKFL